ncbi:MAG: hypothetical protein WCL14_05935 [Bacteroidota bacterium]
MKKFSKIFAIVCLMVMAGIRLFAQDDERALLKQMIKEDRTAIDAISMYPHDIRRDIFIAAKYPEIIVRLESMQKKTQEQFNNLLSPYNRDEQEKIWNLTRYPNLIADLASGRRKSEGDISEILRNYPEEIHKTAMEEGLNNFNLLVTINSMNMDYDTSFESMLNGYPDDAVNAYRELIKQPEILNILSDNMQLTIVIGDVYRKTPDWVMHKSDSANLALATKNAKETEEWKESMNNDPEAQKEYVEAAQEYANENGYSSDDYSTPLAPNASVYYTNSYNWWFGYPSWYPYEYWDPYPYWYDWGFYYGPGRTIIFFGMPSPWLMDWYFYYPEHHHRWCHLSNHYYNYYYIHRESRHSNSVSRSVDGWRRRNSDIVNDDWDRNPDKRTQYFKEYGQMESARAKYNKENPQHSVDRSQYLAKNQGKYPSIKAVAVEKPVGTQTNPQNQFNYQREMPAPEKKPVIKVPDNYKVQPQNNKPTEPNRTNPTKSNQYNAPTQPKDNSQIRSAEQYHQNTWQQIQPSRPSNPTPNRSVSPAPNYTPAPVRTPTPAPRQAPSQAPSQGGGGKKR